MTPQAKAFTTFGIYIGACALLVVIASLVHG